MKIKMKTNKLTQDKITKGEIKIWQKIKLTPTTCKTTKPIKINKTNKNNTKENQLLCLITNTKFHLYQYLTEAPRDQPSTNNIIDTNKTQQNKTTAAKETEENNKRKERKQQKKLNSTRQGWLFNCSEFQNLIGVQTTESWNGEAYFVPSL